MSLDMRHLDIECTLGEKNGAEAAPVVAAATAVVRIEQTSKRPIARVTATKDPSIARIHKVGVIAAPGLGGA